jgi:hypothetical protein
MDERRPEDNQKQKNEQTLHDHKHVSCKEKFPCRKPACHDALHRLDYDQEQQYSQRRSPLGIFEEMSCENRTQRNENDECYQASTSLM